MQIFNIGKPNKKASLNLSINAIVIVVLAMTLLGLGLGFIRNIFTGLEEQREEITEQVKSQILEDLRVGNKKLSFPSTEVNIDKGESKVLALGVKNTNAIEKLNFLIDVKVLQAQVGGQQYRNTNLGPGAPVWEPALLGGIQPEVDFFFNAGPFVHEVTGAEVYSIRATATGTAGVYMVRVNLIAKEVPDDPNSEYNQLYATKTFFINII